MDEQRIWLTAKRLFDKYGKEAATPAALRLTELRKSGDLECAATWQRIRQAMTELERTVPGRRVN